ncbi:MAG: flagellar hook-length control protein FliK, partial [Chloroflexota bacterium]|nr:flagellar hook-length control protein FliK [Chloroflexota bacterium]
MGIQMLSLLPQFAAAPPPSAGDSAGKSGGERFEQLLSAIGRSPAKSGRDDDDSASDGESGALASLRLRLQDLLQGLTRGKVDLAQVGLGLSKRQLDDLLAKLEQLLKTDGQDGTQLLADLLAGSQLAAELTSPDLGAISALLGTAADGSVSASGVASNVRMLAQALRSIDQSDGQLTLQQALQELLPPGDAFAEKLGQLLSHEAPELAAASQGPPRILGDGKAHPPPEDEGAPEASGAAGSNGPEMTPATAGNPSDGAANEASAESEQAGEGAGTSVPQGNGSAGELAAIVKALQALLSEHSAAQTKASPATAAIPSTQASAAAASKPGTTDAAPASRPAAASPLDGPSQPVRGAGDATPANSDTSHGAAAGKAAAAAQQLPGPAIATAEQHTGRGRAAAGGPTGAAEASPGGPAPVRLTLDAGNGQPSNGEERAAGGDAQREAELQQAQTPAEEPLRQPGVQQAAGEGLGPLAPVGAPFAPPMAAAGGSQPAPTLLDQSIVQQIVQQATVALQGGQQEFRIQLKPDFLGALEIRVSMDSTGAAVVRMAAENPATQQLIDANLGQLRQAFGTTHVRVEYVPSF